MADTRGTVLIVDDDRAAVEPVHFDYQLNQVRTLIRFAHDRGDLGAETASGLAEHVGRARRSVGLS